jgi:ribonuclease HI
MNVTAYTDGACRISNPGLCACAFVVFNGKADSEGKLVGPFEERFRHGRFLGTPYTNNYAEYHGVIMLLEWMEGLGYSGCEIWCDSQLVVKQVNCEWRVKENLAELCAKVFGLLHKTNSTLKWLRGHDGNLGNEIADEICNEVLDREQGKSA